MGNRYLAPRNVQGHTMPQVQPVLYSIKEEVMTNVRCPRCKKVNYVVTHDYISLYVIYCKVCEKSFTKCKEKKTENARQK